MLSSTKWKSKMADAAAFTIKYGTFSLGYENNEVMISSNTVLNSWEGSLVFFVCLHSSLQSCIFALLLRLSSKKVSVVKIFCDCAVLYYTISGVIYRSNINNSKFWMLLALEKWPWFFSVITCLLMRVSTRTIYWFCLSMNCVECRRNCVVAHVPWCRLSNLHY